MPIYEFHCEGCEKDSEILIRTTEWQGTKCPHCGSSKLSKKFSVFASSVPGESAPAPAAGCMANSGGCGCGRGGPHKH